jgi:hypothetical protein
LWHPCHRAVLSASTGATPVALPPFPASSNAARADRRNAGVLL